jgi:hypothetical protein
VCVAEPDLPDSSGAGYGPVIRGQVHEHRIPGERALFVECLNGAE